VTLYLISKFQMMRNVKLQNNPDPAKFENSMLKQTTVAEVVYHEHYNFVMEEKKEQYSRTNRLPPIAQ
jgi:hypothetical protein